jgi:hypothetical protein
MTQKHNRGLGTSLGAQASKDASHISIPTSAKTIKDSKESQEKGNLAATNFSFFIKTCLTIDTKVHDPGKIMSIV